VHKILKDRNRALRYEYTDEYDTWFIYLFLSY